MEGLDQAICDALDCRERRKAGGDDSMNARWLIWLGIASAGCTGSVLAHRLFNLGHHRPTVIEIISCPMASSPTVRVLDLCLRCLELRTRGLISQSIVILGNAAIYSGFAYLALRGWLRTPRQLGLPAACAVLYWWIVLFVFDRDVLANEEWGMASPMYTTLTLPWSNWVYGAEIEFGLLGLLFGAANAAILFWLLKGAVELGARIANREF
jgi:hypothetical protein